MSETMETKPVALFLTCLLDNLRPNIGFDVVQLIQACGFKVEVPEAQTCCGQVNYNGGDKLSAQQIAKQVIDVFLPYDQIVAPSGSCASMIKNHYPTLLEDDAVYADKAYALSLKTFELSEFLSKHADFRKTDDNLTLDVAPIMAKVTYHDACAGLREMDIKDQPRALLKSQSIAIEEMQEPETCCGFGGIFCVKYPEISDHMVTKKVMDAKQTNAKALVTGDLGCLINMEGKINRLGLDLPVFHFAEILANPQLITNSAMAINTVVDDEDSATIMRNEAL